MSVHLRLAVASGYALIVEPEERDHVLDVRVALDPARRETGSAGKDRVVLDALLLVKTCPHVLREPEVRRSVVQVTELPSAEPDRQFAALSRPTLTPGHEVTSSTIRRVAVDATVMAAPSREFKMNSIYKFK